jgi:hypothetical protein
MHVVGKVPSLVSVLIARGVGAASDIDITFPFRGKRLSDVTDVA